MESTQIPDGVRKNGTFYYAHSDNPLRNLEGIIVEAKQELLEPPRENPSWSYRVLSRYADNFREFPIYSAICLGVKGIAGNIAGHYGANHLVGIPKESTEILFYAGVFMSIAILIIIPMAAAETGGLYYLREKKKKTKSATSGVKQ